MYQEQTRSSALAELEAMFWASTLDMKVYESFVRFCDAGGRPTPAMCEKLERTRNEAAVKLNHTMATSNTSQPLRISSMKSVSGQNLDTQLILARDATSNKEQLAPQEGSPGYFDLKSLGQNAGGLAETLRAGIDVWSHWNKAQQSKKQEAAKTEANNWGVYLKPAAEAVPILKGVTEIGLSIWAEGKKKSAK